MAVTTAEFESALEHFLGQISAGGRCGWCRDRERSVRPGSDLCETCKGWNRRERNALKERGDASLSDDRRFHLQYEIEFARLCQEEGQVEDLKGYVSALELEWELREISKRFLSEDLFNGAVDYFRYFSPAQRRLLMFLLRRMTKMWLRHHRRGLAIEAAIEKLFPKRPAS
jgi:hypothetical protein